MAHQWSLEWQGSTIKVSSTWAAGSRLYVDDALQDRNGALFGLPACQRLVGRVADAGIEAEITYQLFWPSVVIRIDGQEVFRRSSRGY
ncbi:hypothetical protein FCL40_03975 [Ferrimonas sediminicola]|uniref:Uncharacterized protein n=1 Tax=Ferrimonas sediminicola TaxID=2569538 RepID=A0A4U1BHS9_9GAMM|nr:hypothetical protein [Ferrimonas sediminicola]TKB50326.1 hypothetical protein FCL40_03975 [Ferrimonas sediminicola]